MTHIPDIVDFLMAFDPPDPTWAPARLSMGASIYAALRDAITERSPRYGPDTPSALLGLRVDFTSDLPANVWRLHTADGRVIHDSRSGRKVGP